MNLNFLGTGSAFMPSLYNTSAYFIENEQLFLIDCGETTFEQLKSQNFFDRIQEIFVVFTHTHSDHIAGIGRLINYSYNCLKKRLNIIIPSEDELYENILDLLNIFSISKEKCNFILPYELTNYFNTFNSITFLPTFHTKELEGKTYSLIFNTIYGNVFYSGDSTDTRYIKRLVKESFYKMYIDVTLGIPEAHLDLNILEKLIPMQLRKKVYCMHFDSEECFKAAIKMGFNTAFSTAKNLKSIPITFEHFVHKENKNVYLTLSKCDELTFSKISELNLLENISKIYIVIKNTNANNVSGIGSLLTYSYFILKEPLFIICDDSYKENMLKLAKIYGTPPTSISFVDFINPDILKENFRNM